VQIRNSWFKRQSQKRIDLTPEKAAFYSLFMEELPHTKSCFVCGENNLLGLNLRFHSDGKIVEATFVARPEHCGFQGVIHGGILSTLLDEIMVWACAVNTRNFAFCAELNVRFIAPAAPDEELRMSAELLTNRRNKIFEARASIAGKDGVKATATGKYLPLPRERYKSLQQDMVGKSPQFLDGLL
jgi:uncharacterized protein (TIGR00369 family)